MLNVLISGWGWAILGYGLIMAAFLFAKPLFGSIGVAACVAAAVVAVSELNFIAQCAVFVVALCVAVPVYLRWLYVPLPANATERLSRIAPQMVGMQASLLTPMRLSRGKAQLSDAVWDVRCEKLLPPGTLVKVTGYDGIELEVAPVNSGAA